MVYVSLSDLLWNTPSQYHKFTATEVKILETVIGMKNGNAYAIWKTSGLKHYPTVLRVLKKLYEKRLIRTLGQKGSRDETIYVSSLAATLLLYIIKNETKKLHQEIADNSGLFRELVAVENSDAWSFSVAREIIKSAVTAEKQGDIDDIVRDKVEELLDESLLNISYGDYEQRIMKLAKVKAFRRLILEAAKRQIAENEQHINEMKKLQKRLR